MNSKATMLVFVLLCPAFALAQVASEIRISVQLDKFSWYWEDGDPNNFGTVTQSLAPLPTGTLKPLMRNAIVADVVSVNGKPARGTYVSHGLGLSMTNSDLGRNHAHYFVLDIRTPEGGQIGDLFGTMLASGAAAPGAPPGAGNWAVYGGNGAYLGIRGQGSNAGGSNYHTTIMKEDMAARRTNSSGQLKLDFYLSGIDAPEIQMAYHSASGSPVTNSNPAQAGEVLTLDVKAGWPTSPSRAPGKTFTGEPFQLISLPLEATLNDLPAEVINAIGWPGTRDRYRVDVRLPAPGTPEATLNLLAGYLMASAPYKVPMR
ncbi:MAG: hypothetical protein M1541_08905 [Acidobacteria bacterium]|nr:hypothetical protein [Acidobacteriota bacterium]